MISLKSLNAKLSSLDEKLNELDQKHEEDMAKLCAYVQQLALALNSVAGEEVVSDQTSSPK